MSGARSDVRARLLKAAREELSVSGVVNVSLRAIARRVGISHQATTHYFDDRSALFTQLAVEGFGALREDFEQARASVDGNDPAESVAVLGAAYLRFAAAQPALFDLMYGSGGGLVDPADEELARARLEVWSILVDTITRAAERGWGGGQDVDVLAVAAWSSVHGLAVLRGQGTAGGIVDLEPEQLARVIAGMVRVDPTG